MSMMRRRAISVTGIAMIANLLLWVLGILQLMSEGSHSALICVAPYMKKEPLLSHIATANATTNLFLFQMAMLAGSGYMGLLWK